MLTSRTSRSRHRLCRGDTEGQVNIMIRIGYGTDIHRLIEGHPLILGAVDVRSDLGADGHSDADALMHAATDAVLGALALGDIFNHFPEDVERWRNASSSQFLEYAAGLIRDR